MIRKGSLTLNIIFRGTAGKYEIDSFRKHQFIDQSGTHLGVLQNEPVFPIVSVTCCMRL